MMLNKQTMIMAMIQLILGSKVRNQLTPKDWVKVLLIAESRGMLYYGFDNDKLSKIAIAYRVPEITENVDEIIPQKEEGTILWVAVFVSLSQDKDWIKKEGADFFNRYKDISEIAYEDEINEKIVRIKRSSLNGEKQNRHRATAGIQS